MRPEFIESFWGAPPADRKLIPGEIHVWSAVLNQPPAVVMALQLTLMAEECLKASRLRRTEDRERAIIGRGLLRQILASYLQVEPGSLAFQYGANGKPALAGHELRFNLSHSEALFLCAVSAHCDVGIDVERTGQVTEAPAIVERCFSAEEKNLYQNAPEAQRPVVFHQLWTRKEAVAKCSGRGIAEERPAGKVDYSIFDLTPAAGYIGALAVPGPPCPLQMWQWPVITPPA